ncbi:MAG TPA: FAD-dependent oxidoreductase [Solirubrobacterales bacterium]|nr:FAD-dependent oxidoreductase [Solirubrobacterales bacterium]
MHAKSKVLVAGGGVAALEAALALRELGGDRLDVELRAPRAEFVYRPVAVGEPFGAARMLRYDLGALAQRIGASFLLGGIHSVDPRARVATTRDGERLPYDFLIVASGARSLWAVPGAVTFWGAADEGGFGAVVRKLRAGVLRDVVFTMPGGRSWGLPLYELALLGATVPARSGIADAKLTVATPEDAPLELFGRAVGEQMAGLLEERGIGLRTGVHPVAFEHGLLRVAPGDPIEAGAVVSLPRLEGRRIDGLPTDAEGFLPVDEHCRVTGVEHVYAAGDGTAFPLKQGGIATQEADAAAAAIAAAAGCEVEAAPFVPELRAVLWTGAEPRYLYGRPAGGAGEVSKLSREPLWPQAEGKIVGRYLSPFLAGLPDDAGRALASR